MSFFTLSLMGLAETDFGEVSIMGLGGGEDAAAAAAAAEVADIL